MRVMRAKCPLLFASLRSDQSSRSRAKSSRESVLLPDVSCCPDRCADQSAVAEVESKTFDAGQLRSGITCSFSRLANLPPSRLAWGECALNQWGRHCLTRN